MIRESELCYADSSLGRAPKPCLDPHRPGLVGARSVISDGGNHRSNYCLIDSVLLLQIAQRFCLPGSVRLLQPGRDFMTLGHYTEGLLRIVHLQGIMISLEKRQPLILGVRNCFRCSEQSNEPLTSAHMQGIIRPCL